jgi:glycosyltransferase involved in cell wall biosynthesis
MGKKTEDKLKVMLVASIVLPISKKLKYAGTERVIDALTDHLSEMDVDLTVAATGDSEVSKKATLIHTHNRSLWPLGHVVRKIIDFADEIEYHYQYSHDYAVKWQPDVVHDHTFFINSEAYESFDLDIPVVHTLHGDVLPEEAPLYKTWRRQQKAKKKIHFVAISNSQKRKFQRLAGIKVHDVVYNGVPVEIYPFAGWEHRQDYLLWIGRICKEKGTDLAIKLAKESGMPLIIAGEVHTNYQHFYETEIKPHITHFIQGNTFSKQESRRQELVSQIEKGERIINPGEILYLGPLDDNQKKVLYSRAHALLVLNRWEEPFGLVMPEAMATGTPVIGTKRGSIPEVVSDKVTGFVIPLRWVNKKKGVIDEGRLMTSALVALAKIKSIDPAACRKRVEEMFSGKVMAQNYYDVYRKVLKNVGSKGEAAEVYEGIKRVYKDESIENDRAKT